MEIYISQLQERLYIHIVK